MDLDVILAQAKPQILDEAFSTLDRMHVAHYEVAGEQFTRQRLTDLFDLVIDAIRHRDLSAVVTYSERIADERFTGGFGIADVQTAFNSLEQAMWRCVVVAEPPTDLAEAVGLLGTVLGAGKDALAREYVSLASCRHVPTLDLSSLFAGTAA